MRAICVRPSALGRRLLSQSMGIDTVKHSSRPFKIAESLQEAGAAIWPTQDRETGRVLFMPGGSFAGQAERSFAGLGTILIPTSLSVRSIAAVSESIRIADRLHAEIILLHVFEQQDPRFRAGCHLDDQIARCRLTGEQQAILDRCLETSQRVRPRFAIGSCAETIVHTAREERADIIVMQTPRVSGWRSIFFSSGISDAVFAAAPCPIWTATGESFQKQKSNIRQILCAVAPQAGSERLLRWASGLALQCNAVLSIVYAGSMPEPIKVRVPFGAGIIPSAPSILEWIESLQENAGTRAAVWLRDGEAADRISWVAENVEADVVVIGRGPAAPFAASAAGVYRFTKRMPCPVVSC